MITRFFYWVVCLFGLAASPLDAHDLGLAQVDLVRTDPDSVHLSAKLSATVDAPLPVLPMGCEVQAGVPRAAPGGNQRVEWAIACSGVAMPNTIKLPWSLQAAMVSHTGKDGQITGTLVSAVQDGIVIAMPGAVVEEQSFWQVLGGYTNLGIKHILIGPDHIALLICLSILASGWTLVRLATAFTIGHSVTLGLAALELVRVPTQPMEAVIALSVMYLARDVALGRKFGPRHAGLLAGIGLIHGLGFASVLGEVGLPPTAKVSALLGFNLGVEIGQILVLVVMAMTGMVFFRVLRLHSNPALFFSGWVVGILAAFWTLERIAVAV